MRILAVFLAAVLAGCATIPPPKPTAITESEIRATMAVLASDSFEGRMAGTPDTQQVLTTHFAFVAAGRRSFSSVSHARDFVCQASHIGPL